MNEDGKDDKSDPFRGNACRLSSLVRSLKLDQDNPYHTGLIKEVLAIPDSHRDRQLREALQDWMSSLDFFSGLRETNGDAYCQKFYGSMTADSYRQGKILIRTGDDSDYFYIVLSGAVMVLYPRRRVDMQLDCKGIDSAEVLKLNHKERILRRAENHTHFRGVPLQSIDHYEKYFNELGVPIVSVENVLEKGRAFGELGILYRTKRCADIVCRDDSLIARVGKDRYLQIVGEESQRKFAKTLEFLTEHFYSNMSRMIRFDAHRYLYLFEEVEWKVNSVIFEWGTPLRGLFIIRQGCVVLKSQELYEGPEKIGIERLGIFKSNRKRKLVAFKELGVGECFGLEPFVKSGNMHYNYEAMATLKSKLLYCNISQLTEIMKFDKELERQVVAKFTLKEQLNPIREARSASTKLENYCSALRNNKPPEYRINPLLLQKPTTIRSPRIQSLYEAADNKENEKNMLLCSRAVVPTHNRMVGCKRPPLLQPRKCMSRALELRITQDIASSLERKLAQWAKRKGETADQHRIMQRKLERKQVEMRMKHIRIS